MEILNLVAQTKRFLCQQKRIHQQILNNRDFLATLDKFTSQMCSRALGRLCITFQDTLRLVSLTKERIFYLENRIKKIADKTSHKIEYPCEMNNVIMLIARDNSCVYFVYNNQSINLFCIFNKIIKCPVCEEYSHETSTNWILRTSCGSNGHFICKKCFVNWLNSCFSRKVDSTCPFCRRTFFEFLTE